MVAYTRGLHEAADGVWRGSLQPDGGWGWSNAGLARRGRRCACSWTPCSTSASRPRCWDEMRSGGRSRRPRIDTVVNTHANGDHCYGNALLDGSEIISTARCAEEMLQLPPSSMAAMMRSADSPLGSGRPCSSGAHLRPVLLRGRAARRTDPARSRGSSTSGSASVRVGAARGGSRPHRRGRRRPSPRTVEGVVFTGDILFHGGHPIVWSGPVANWLTACDRVLALRPYRAPGGHGPLATPAAPSGPEGDLRAPDSVRCEGALRGRRSHRSMRRGTSTWARTQAGARPSAVVANVHALYRDASGTTRAG